MQKMRITTMLKAKCKSDGDDVTKSIIILSFFIL